MFSFWAALFSNSVVTVVENEPWRRETCLFDTQTWEMYLGYTDVLCQASHCNFNAIIVYLRYTNVPPKKEKLKIHLLGVLRLPWSASHIFLSHGTLIKSENGNEWPNGSQVIGLRPKIYIPFHSTPQYPTCCHLEGAYEAPSCCLNSFCWMLSSCSIG